MSNIENIESKDKANEVLNIESKTLLDTIEQEETIKYYSKPPLPFLGNKKQCIKIVESLISIYKNKLQSEGKSEKDIIFLDCFGGSGLLSNTFKYYFNDSLVVWNDYDDYQRRLDLIPTTNEIIAKIRPIILKYKNNQKFKNEDKEAILNLLLEYNEEVIDYISISSLILFSGNYAHDYNELKKGGFYYKGAELVKNKERYLIGVKRERMDFKDLISKYKELAKIESKTLFLLLDPPYLQTLTSGYKDNFYSLKDFLSLVDLIMKPYIFFSSERSDIREFLKWYDTKDSRLKERQQIAYLLSNINGARKAFLDLKEEKSLFDNLEDDTLMDTASVNNEMIENTEDEELKKLLIAKEKRRINDLKRYKYGDYLRASKGRGQTYHNLDFCFYEF